MKHDKRTSQKISTNLVSGFGLDSVGFLSGIGRPNSSLSLKPNLAERALQIRFGTPFRDIYIVTEKNHTVDTPI